MCNIGAIGLGLQGVGMLSNVFAQRIGAIGLGLQGVGMLSNVFAQRQQAQSYSNYQSLQAQAALNNYIQQSKQINLRYAQEQEANTEEREQIRIENMKAKATAQASAASSGIEGVTIDNLFAGYERATAVSNYTHAKNLQMLGLEYNNQLDTYRIQALNSINTMQQYNGASTASTLLSGVGGLFSAYSNNKMKQEQLQYYKSYTQRGGV